jgi:hypothetical protein
MVKPAGAAGADRVLLSPAGRQFMTLGRLRLHTDDQSAWTLGWLLLDDHIVLSTDSVDERVNADYRDEYTWLAYEHGVDEALHSRTVFAGTWAERSLP